MSKKKSIIVKDNNISILKKSGLDYISLTDIAKTKNPEEPKDVVKNWMRNRSTVEFLGLWEKINNPKFNGVEFDPLYEDSGKNSFTLSPTKWINNTNSTGIVLKTGRGGGTYAHKDIAFEFGSWISAEFKLYLIKEFQRLKNDENDRLKLDWNLQRTLSKVNYTIHTDAIKEMLIPEVVASKTASFIYASEADILNIALYGITAKQWRENNPQEEGNIRDVSTIEQLVVLPNLESINSVLIHQELSQQERIIQLNKIAITQMKSLIKHTSLKGIQH